MRPGSCNVIKKSLHFCLLQSLENLTRGISSPASGWELRSLWSTVQSYRHLNSKTATTVSGQSFKSPTLCRDQCKMTPLPSPSGAFAGGEPHTLERRPSPSALCPPPRPPILLLQRNLWPFRRQRDGGKGNRTQFLLDGTIRMWFRAF